MLSSDSHRSCEAWDHRVIQAIRPWSACRLAGVKCFVNISKLITYRALYFASQVNPVTSFVVRKALHRLLSGSSLGVGVGRAEKGLLSAERVLAPRARQFGQFQSHCGVLFLNQLSTQESEMVCL